MSITLLNNDELNFTNFFFLVCKTYFCEHPIKKYNFEQINTLYNNILYKYIEKYDLKNNEIALSIYNNIVFKSVKIIISYKLEYFQEILNNNNFSVSKQTYKQHDKKIYMIQTSNTLSFDDWIYFKNDKVYAIIKSVTENNHIYSIMLMIIEKNQYYCFIWETNSYVSNEIYKCNELLKPIIIYFEITKLQYIRIVVNVFIYEFLLKKNIDNINKNFDLKIIKIREIYIKKNTYSDIEETIEFSNDSGLKTYTNPKPKLYRTSERNKKFEEYEIYKI